MSNRLLFAVDILTVTVAGERGRTGRLDLNTGSAVPARLGAVDAIELAALLVRWASSELAHRNLTMTAPSPAARKYPKP